MNWPKITVVLPSFNQGQYIDEALYSIVSQGYPNLELIVIDGGSTDNSVDVIRKYEKKMHYWVSEPDGSQTRGLIKGFARASGDIQCWLNSDDVFMESTLFEVARYFYENPEIDAVYGDAVWVNRTGAVLREQREIPFNRFIWMYTHNYIPSVSMFWRRAVYEKVGGLDPSYELAMDADLWIRFAEVGRIGHVRRTWAKMRFYPEQKNRRLRAESDAEDIRIRERYWGGSYPSYHTLKRALAYVLRVGWKVMTGCYPLGYHRLERLERR
ncbi:MAG: glycosyltransferase [Gammaproteobacteria bacterium]|nr:glycosyltransferase [Gammaproteobacteria bacterium]MDH3378584.1 glycosyltransferase [Gammaproteobacteria bacterium]